MVNKNLLLPLLLISVVVNFFTVYKLHTFKKKAAIAFSAQEHALKNSEALLTTTRDNFRQSLIWQLKYEGNSINQNTKIVASDRSIYYVKDLVSTQPKLIYRITEKSCDVCYDKITDKLNIASELIGWDNIIVIVPIKELRKTIAAFKEQGIKSQLFAVTEELALNIPLENSTSPFFFIVNEDFRIRSLFIPHKNGAELTENYLYEMSEKYFKRNG